MISGPKYKICRRLGNGVFDKCQTTQYVSSEARHTKTKGRGGKAPSDFGKQLLEKQKVRFAYGVMERQLRRYIEEATKKNSDGDPVERFLTQLEMRLDNVVYRAGLANSRRLARQMVSHGHIVVNGRRMTIPSYHAKEGDVFGVREQSKTKPLFENRKEAMSQVHAPAWMTFDMAKLEGKIKGIPAMSATEVAADLRVVLEFYSR